MVLFSATILCKIYFITPGSLQAFLPHALTTVGGCSSFSFDTPASDVQEKFFPFKWTDILCDEGRMVLHSSKTEHNPIKESRVVPLFPGVATTP